MKLSEVKEHIFTLRKFGVVSIPEMIEDSRPAFKNIFNMSGEEIFSCVEALESEGDYGLGMLTGKLSNVIAIDLDEDVDDLHKQIIALLPVTKVAKFGSKGVTLFYKYSGEKSRSYYKNGRVVVEVLSDNKKTTMPPSTHRKTKKPYVFKKGSLETFQEELSSIPSESLLKLEALFFQPKTLKEFVKETHNLLSSETWANWLYVGQVMKQVGLSKEEWVKWSLPHSKGTEDFEQLWNYFSDTSVDNYLRQLERHNVFYKKDLSDSFYSKEELEKSLNRYSNREGVVLGIPTFDKRFKFFKGDITLISGKPGSGKSTFTAFLAQKFVIENGMSGIYAEYESESGKTVRNLARASQRQPSNFLNEVEDKLFFLKHDVNEIDRIEEIAKYAKERHGISFIFIDPYFTLKKDSESEYLNVSKFINMLKRIKMLNLIVVVVAHPKILGYDEKINFYNVAGGSSWSNGTDNFFSMSRNKDDSSTTFEFLKIKDEDYGSLGEVTLSFDKEKKQYVDKQIVSVTI